MNEVKIFENTEFGKVRTVVIDGEPYFVGKDVAEALGYSDTVHAVLDHVDEDDRVNSKTQGQNDLELGQRGGWLINESGVYSLVFGSKLPNAKKFKKWVTSEVLPTIRKTGSYSMNIPKTLPEALRAYANEVEAHEKTKLIVAEQKDVIAKNNQLIGEMKPKADYVDRILDSRSLMPVTLIAKDYGYSGKGFNKLLKEHGVQYRIGKQWVLYSKYQACGYTHSKQYIEITNSKGEPVSNMEWTQKGRLFLYNFLKERNIVPLIEQDC